MLPSGNASGPNIEIKAPHTSAKPNRYVNDRPTWNAKILKLFFNVSQLKFMFYFKTLKCKHYF